MLAILLGITLLGIFICISFIVYNRHNKNKLNKKKKLIILLITVLLTILSIGNIVAQCIILTHVHNEEEKTQTINIVSYNYYGYTEETEVNYGGYSYIVTDEKEEYVYYYKVASGGYKQGTIPSKNAVIYEENDCKNPSIIAYTTYTKSNYGLDIKKWTALEFLTTTRYEIRIPKGTAIKSQ